MKKFLSATLVAVVLMVSAQNGLFAQNEASTQTKSGLDGGSLNSQFDFLIKKTEAWNEYQMIKRPTLYKIKGNTLDSIKTLKSSISSLETQVQDQQKEINLLKSSQKEIKEELDRAIKERDSFNFMGILLTKGVYNSILWTLILVLIAGLAIVLFLFKRSNHITIKTKEALNEKQEEFDKHRKWALEREQTLARDLNKLKQKYKGLD